MLHLLMLATGALLPQAGPLDAPSRAAAARTLAGAIEAAPPGAQLSTWIAAGRAALEELAPGALRASLARSVEDARWRALTDAGLAARLLEEELRDALDDLRFEPLIEAQLPRGFPAPTPVREIELKRYPSYRMARTDLGGAGSNGGFWRLFGHIQSHDIAMTAPVETTYAADDGGWSEARMAFLYGSPDTGDTGPDAGVEVVDVAPGLYLSIGCRGSLDRASLAAARERLGEWLASRPELEVAGEPRSMGYNSPMVPRSRRYFEVQIPVREQREPDRSELVIDFGAEDAARRWSPVDDTVMGGRSASRLVSSGEGSCVFEGQLSLENGGGFASVRTRPAAMGLEGARALRLRFRGDGKAYKLRLRTSDAFDGVSYEAAFPSEDGVWSERRFALEDFVPVWRGRRVPDAPELVPQSIQSVGLMIAGGQAGPFRLELSALHRE